MGKLGCWKPGRGQERFKTHRHVCMCVHVYMRRYVRVRVTEVVSEGHNSKPYGNAVSTVWPGRQAQDESSKEDGKMYIMMSFVICVLLQILG
jgi:hypothetical protein